MRLIALFCMLLLSSISSASLVIHSVEKKEVLRYAWILDDVGDILTIEQVIETARQNRFVASQTDTLHTQLDLSSKWLRLDVENPTNIQHFVMSLNGLIGGEWQLYRVNGNSSPYESIELLSLEQGDFTHIDMRTGQNLFYLKISPNSPSSISIDLQGQTEYVNAQRNKLLLYGLFVGGLVSLMCLFLVMWWRMRNIGLILPFGYMLMFAVIQNSIVTPYPMLIAPNNAIFITMAMAVSLLASISFIIFKNQISTRWQVVLISSGIVQVFMSIGWAWLPISLKFLGSLVIFANLLLCTLVWLLHYGVKENGQRQIIICWALLTLLTLLELCKLNGFDLWPSLFHLEVMVLSLLHLLLLLLAISRCCVLTSTSSVPQVSHDGVPPALLRKLNHDMRGPINGVLGMTELLNETSLSAHQYEYLKTIMSSGYQLLNIADEMRGYAHINESSAYQSEEEFYISEMLDTLITPFRHLASQKNLELISEWSPKTELKIAGPKLAIEQILRTLVDNAISYADSGEVVLQVKKMPEGNYRFRITDVGPGLTALQQKRLFSISDDVEKATHFGLPLIQMMAKAIGTKIELSSEREYGTTFWFSMDLKEVVDSERSQHDVDPLFLSSLKGIKVLIVDDSQSCRNVLQYQLDALGVYFQTVSSGQQAIAALQSYRSFGDSFDLVLLDYQMPIMDGIEVAKRIRQNEHLKSLHIIMLSGRDLSSLESQLHQLNIHQLLNKPVTGNDLKLALVQALKQMKQL